MGDAVLQGQLVSIAYTASIGSSGEILDTVSAERPLTMKKGDRTLPLFQEATEGMRIGGKRRVKLPPSSVFAGLGEEIMFDIELVGIQTGLSALAYQTGRNVGPILRTAILLTFLPDVLNLLGVVMQAGSSGVDSGLGTVLSNNAAAPVAEAANQW